MRNSRDKYTVLGIFGDLHHTNWRIYRYSPISAYYPGNRRVVGIYPLAFPPQNTIILRSVKEPVHR